MQRPNLLVIHTDQQSTWAVGAYGDGLIETPHTDRLANEGALFTQFFTNSAICTPSRGCFVTGRYPHAHGAYRNNLSLGRDEVTFAEVLKRQGYATGYAGKWHLDGIRRPGWMHEERSMGFHDCRYMFNRGHWKKIEDVPMGDCQPAVYRYGERGPIEMGDETTYTTDWLTTKTIEFVDKHVESSPSQPFCYMVSIPDPHPPVECRTPYDTLFNADDMVLPETFDEENVPNWAEEARSKGDFAPDTADRAARMKRKKALYLGEVKLIDDCVGRMLDALANHNVLDNTVVVFTTDHGEYMGEHGLKEKNEIYEPAYRIPTLIRWPESIPAGTRVERITSTVDFQPTILGLMGTPTCGREQGHDASAFLRGEEREWCDEAMLYHHTHQRAGIFTPEYELALVENGDCVLFDRRNDPLQANNLYHDPEYREDSDALTRRVVLHNVEVGAPAAEWLRKL